MISYIVSFFNRGAYLDCCLASLGVQAHNTADIVVCCNATDEAMVVACGIVCNRHGVKMKLTGLAGATCCYSSAEMAVPETAGDWLCFPSEDSYYLPRFSDVMLKTARDFDVDLVYSAGVLYSKAQTDYIPFVHQQEPTVNMIDKTAFIMKKSWFQPFPGKNRAERTSSDGLFIEELRRRKIRFSAAEGVWLVHN